MQTTREGSGNGDRGKQNLMHKIITKRRSFNYLKKLEI